MKKLGVALLIGAVMSIYACKKDYSVKPTTYHAKTLADGPPDSTGIDSDGDGHPHLPPH